MIGEETRRSRSLRRVAITRVEVTFSDESEVETFLRVIEQSDERLRAVADADATYDWQIVRRKDMTIRFGVAWYDSAFYAARKNAYRSEMHSKLMGSFGSSPDEMRVEHIPL